MLSNEFNSILFLCVANSARSQIAEGLARRIFGESVRIQSAGSQPTRVNPWAISVLDEVGIGVEGHESKSVDKIERSSVDLVVTLCAEEVCPVFLGDAQRLHWPLQDPDRKNEHLTDDERIQNFRIARDQIEARLQVLKALHEIPAGPEPKEFHASIRVPDLAASTRFYAWLLGVTPREWTHRYAIFISDPLRLNLVILVDDGTPLHQDTLYHLGVDVGSREAVVSTNSQAVSAGWSIHKPARTTWRGTPLHELWLKDPGGNLVEVYARLTEEERDLAPENMEPTPLCESEE